MAPAGFQLRAAASSPQSNEFVSWLNAELRRGRNALEAHHHWLIREVSIKLQADCQSGTCAPNSSWTQMAPEIPGAFPPLGQDPPRLPQMGSTWPGTSKFLDPKMNPDDIRYLREELDVCMIGESRPGTSCLLDAQERQLWATSAAEKLRAPDMLIRDLDSGDEEQDDLPAVSDFAGTVRKSVASKNTDTDNAQKSRKSRSSTTMPGFVPGKGVQSLESFRDQQEVLDTQSQLGRMVRSDYFDVIFAGFILGNTLVMMFEWQYKGLDTAFAMEVPYAGYNAAATKVWPNAMQGFQILEWFFGVLFTIEILLKLAVYQKTWFLDVWNYLDALIVAAWMVDAISMAASPGGKPLMPLDPMLLRLVRLVRLLRLLRIVKSIKGFDSLFLMTTSVKGSLSILLWTIALLFVMNIMMSLLLMNYLDPWLKDSAHEATDAQRFQVFEYFGTFSRCMRTMLQMSFGKWETPALILMNNVDEWFLAPCLLYHFVVGFAIMKVVGAIFIHETLRVANSDDRIMLMTNQRELKFHTIKMQNLFKAADDDGSGEIDVEEFKNILQNDEVRMWLGAMQLETGSPDELFQLIDMDGGGTVDAAELVKGVRRLKGPAKAFDVVALIKCMQGVTEMMTNMHDKLCPAEEEERQGRENRFSIRHLKFAQ